MIRDSSLEAEPVAQRTAHVRPAAWRVACVGTAIVGVVVLRQLLFGGMDPTLFLAIGEGKPIQRGYAERLLGPVLTRPQGGHDGKFFFVQANDPWFLDPGHHAVVLDRTLYRGQRMLYPMLAGGFGALPPSAVVWGLIVVNVIAFGIGTFVAAKLAEIWGASTWLGLAVPLNVGLMSELTIDGSGVVAYVCCLLGLYALVRHHTWLAAIGFAAGALSREAMVLFAIGILVLWWITWRDAPWRIVILPAIALVTWNVYLRVRLAGISGTGGAPTLIEAPFLGLARAARSWLAHPVDLLLSVVILTVIVAFSVLALRTRSPLAWGALPFVALLFVLGAAVWEEPFDLSRAIAPVFTAAAFLVASPDRTRPLRLEGDGTGTS